MNCPISVVDVGSTRVAQAHNSSIWRGDSRPVPPFRSNRTSASMPPSWNSLIQMRMVESSTKRTLATFLEAHSTVEQQNGVRPAGDAILLQPVPGDRHKVGPIRCTEEIAVGLHRATGIDPADSVKRFPKERGIPLHKKQETKKRPLYRGRVRFRRPHRFSRARARR